MTTVKVEIVSDELLACRICLATDVKMYSIYDDRLDEAFAEIMGTSLSVQDGYPQYLCCYCRTLLLKSFNLRARCQRANDLLKESLLQQHYISLDYIRSIDRAAHRLIPDDDSKIDNQELEKSPVQDFPDISNDSSQFLSTLCAREVSDAEITDVLVKNDPNYVDLPAVKIVEIENGNLKLVDSDVDDLKMEETFDEIKTEVKREGTKRKRTIKKEKVKKKKLKRGVKKKDVIKIEDRPLVEWVAKKKSTYKRTKKGFKRYFMCEEDYLKFEERYNIEVVRLTEEEQQREMEARKESDNYMHALVRCEKCFKGFLSMFTYENHIKVHDPAIGPNECHFCFCRFKWPNKLRTHLIECHQLKYVCKECKLVIRGRYMAVMHAQFHAGKTWECRFCPLTFKKQSTFYTHLRINHSTENASGGTCDICGETFTGAMGLRMHKTQTHNKKEIKALKCTICKLQFENKDALDAHRNTPSGECDPKLRFCESCGAMFADEDQLSLHRQHQHGVQIYKCDECSKSFLSKASLSTHMERVHLNIKPRFKFYNYKKSNKKQSLRLDYMCETCGKAYTCLALLKTHQMSHTGERPFKCSQCPKTFITASQLKGHKDSFHARIRKYRCPQCPKTFLRQSSIYKHRLIHTGEKPYECNICSKAFTQSGSLTTHVKYVHMKLKPPPRKRKLEKYSM